MSPYYDTLLGFPTIPDRIFLSMFQHYVAFPSQWSKGHEWHFQIIHDRLATSVTWARLGSSIGHQLKVINVNSDVRELLYCSINVFRFHRIQNIMYVQQPPQYPHPQKSSAPCRTNSKYPLFITASCCCAMSAAPKENFSEGRVFAGCMFANSASLWSQSRGRLG